MADCNETLRELEAFLDHELSDDALHGIRAHLDGCLDCLQAFDFHAELKMVIAQKCRDEAMPPGLLTKIEQCFGDDYLVDGESGRESGRVSDGMADTDPR